MTFKGGPLGGTDRPKHEHGRWPRYLDNRGEPVPTGKIELYRLGPAHAPAGFRMYGLENGSWLDEDGMTTVRAYRWLGTETEGA